MSTFKQGVAPFAGPHPEQIVSNRADTIHRKNSFPKKSNCPHYSTFFVPCLPPEEKFAIFPLFSKKKD